MKTSSAISINMQYHSHQQFLASKCEWGLPKLRSSRCLPPSNGDCWGAWGNARSSHLPLLKVNKETGLAPDSWGAFWKKWIQWTQRLASSHTQNSKFPNLLSDLWCSDCLLSLLHTLYSLTPLLASLERFSQSHWDFISWSPSTKLSHQIK